MSHFTSIQTEVRDLDALHDACSELGLALCHAMHARGYGQTRRKAAHIVRLQGPYDIAVDPNPDGTYELTTDWWNGHVEKEVGPNYGRLLQSYGVHKTLREARTRGLRATRRVEADGSILLTLEGASL